MELIVTDANGVDVAAVVDFALDMEFGDESENNFELVINEQLNKLSAGSYIYIDGTDYGGVIDKISTEHTRKADVLTYYGRTWHGVLANQIVCPASGADYYTSSGEANECILALIDKLDLNDIFSVSTASTGVTISYQWERYTDAYSGLRDMLAQAGLKLNMRRSSGKVLLEALDTELYGADSDLIEFDLTRDYRPVNHLICGGQGELSSRLIVHLYADVDGNISTTQTQFGADEVAEFYDYSNADDSTELTEKGTEKLHGYQSEGEISITITDDSEVFDIGDEVEGRDNKHGLSVSATVSQKVVKVSKGVAAISYSVSNAIVYRE